MQLAHTGLFHSSETSEKISATNQGRILTPDTKALMKIGQQARRRKEREAKNQQLIPVTKKCGPPRQRRASLAELR